MYDNDTLEVSCACDLSYLNSANENHQLLGYGLSSPFLGWLNLQSPMEVLFGEKRQATDLF